MVVIAISGMPGCGSSTTAKLLAEKMEVKFFSAGDYTKKLAKDEEKIDKKQTERIVDFWETKRGKSKKHHMAVEELQQNLAKKGNIIIESKIGIHFLKSDFKIWLKAPLKIRARRYVKRDKIPLKNAISFLRKKQDSERKNWKRIYGFDYFDQEKEANLIINTGNKKPKEIVDIIIKSIGDKI